ncbi:hypothetical protein K505DRAFT_251336, partial [Melanomma pulvis-pyrius CBS 109.77]
EQVVSKQLRPNEDGDPGYMKIEDGRHEGDIIDIIMTADQVAKGGNVLMGWVLFIDQNGKPVPRDPSTLDINDCGGK